MAMRGLGVQVANEIVQWPFLTILSASVLLALVIPPGWMQWALGSSILQPVTEWVPATRDFIRYSRFPDVAAVYFPLMLVLSPLHFLWMWRTMSRRSWVDQFQNRPGAATTRLLVVLFLTLLIGFGTFVEGGGQLDVIPWNESRIALALAGYMASGGGFFVVLASLVLGCQALIHRIGARNG